MIILNTIKGKGVPEFENDPAWHARKLTGKELVIGKKPLELNNNEEKIWKIINDLAKKDDKIVLIVGDIGYGIFDEFRKNHPKNFIILESVNKA